MAYNNYFPQYYPMMPQQAMPSQMQNNQQASNGGITWVQGEAAAKSYPVAAGQSVLLMDSEASAFYIKSTDQSGMPQPLRIFDYSERTTAHSEAGVVKTESGDYVSRAEFDRFKEEIKRSMKGIRKPTIELEEGEG